jgi:hypothetical protein
MRNVLLAVSMAALAMPVARATDPPEIKEGLWQIHTQTTDNPGAKKSEGTYSLCRDHAYDKSVQAKVKQMPGCTAANESFEAGKYSVQSHCVRAGTTIDSKSTTTSQGDTVLRSETHATYSPALFGVSESTMVTEQKYAGSCPAGVQPGDRINADGSVMHRGKK